MIWAFGPDPKSLLTPCICYEVGLSPSSSVYLVLNTVRMLVIFSERFANSKMINSLFLFVILSLLVGTIFQNAFRKHESLVGPLNLN